MRDARHTDEARLAALHAYFLNEFERHADDSAVQLLGEIRTEVKRKSFNPAAIPTVNADVRLDYLNKMFHRAMHPQVIDRMARILREIRKEDARHGG